MQLAQETNNTPGCCCCTLAPTDLQAELVGQGKHQRVLEARGIQQLVAAQSDGVGPAAYMQAGRRGDAAGDRGLFARRTGLDNGESTHPPGAYIHSLGQ